MTCINGHFPVHSQSLRFNSKIIFKFNKREPLVDKGLALYRKCDATSGTEAVLPTCSSCAKVILA